MVVGRDHGLQTQILNWFHSLGLGGHSGVHATYQRMSTILYWKGMWKSVREFVRNCSVCQQNKAENMASPGLLQPLSIPTSIFSDISMDFVKGLPRLGSKDVILVVVDRLTKYNHFIPLANPFTIDMVANAFMEYVYKLHENPGSIAYDRGPTFVSKF